MSALSKIKRRLKSCLSFLDRFLLRIAASSRFSAGLYYLVTGHFGREHVATLAGRIAYNRSLRDPQESSALLRRNVHRLEKGLLMRPRRVPFALNYIEETVSAYARAAEGGVQGRELCWARDVLSEYMAVTPAHPAVDPLRATVRDASAKVASVDTCEQMIPYVRRLEDAPSITYEDLLGLAKFRRSVRWFLPKAVPREMVEKAVLVAGYSPTACNRQPYEFRIIDDPELVKKAIKLPMGTAGFSHQVPALAVVVGKQRNYFKERDRHLIYTDGSLAIMSFVYALEVQGLGSCCINWPDIEDREAKMASFLGLAPDERPIMLVAFGFPDPEGMVAYSGKKPVSVICKYNFEAK